MRFLKNYAVLLSVMILIIAGCGGGGGSAPAPDTTVPNVIVFALPATASSLNVPISGFTASDNIGITGYLVTESATALSAGDSGWSGTAPGSFIFSTSGVKTAYGWVKDAAGNVSASRSATVTITLPTTKTVTLKFLSQSTNSADLITGFDLTATLPVGAVLSTDVAGVPVPGTVFLSGQFAGANSVLTDISYDSVLRQLKVNYAGTSTHQLGEFITVIFTVPVSYVPNTSDIAPSITAYDGGGNVISTVSATAAFN
jgi:hypothetical protein